MKNIKSVVSTMLLGCGFISASFASQPFTVQYKNYSAYTKDACSPSIIKLIESEDHLTLTYEAKSPGEVVLLGSTTQGVTVTEPAKLSKEEHNDMYAYMLSDNNAKLQVAGTPFKLQQLWIESASDNEPWESAFYIGEGTGCLVMTSRKAETNSLAQPRE